LWAFVAVGDKNERLTICFVVTRNKLTQRYATIGCKGSDIIMGHTMFTREEISKIVWNYLDKKGANGLSKKEVELTKPFFADLFVHFHENAKTNTSLYCTRKDCSLSDNEPVFVTGSGRVLCKDCALQYIIGNLSDWRYYLGDIAAGIGYVPSSLQSKGLALQKMIDEQRA
jgi:hypothetical protein